MKGLLRAIDYLSIVVCAVPPTFTKTPKAVNAKHFDAAAQAALAAMKARASELKIQGIAVVAFAPGDSIEVGSQRWR